MVPTEMVMDLRNSITTVPRQIILWPTDNGANQHRYLEIMTNSAQIKGNKLLLSYNSYVPLI